MNAFTPLVEVTRGPLVESIHFGTLAVSDAAGNLIASLGDPLFVANLRSTAKPFQALSMVESGAMERFALSERELAIVCASHSGTDEQAALLDGLQAKIGVRDTDLMCGVHFPMDEETTGRMRAAGQTPTPNRHNCSGKHTGMLAQARTRGFDIRDYTDPAHPVQEVILAAYAGMMDLAPTEVPVGIDGCSAPTFAAPLRNAAHAFALLADPQGLPEPRAAALRRIFQAMSQHPDMVAGPGRFDTLVMQAGAGRVAAKGGAEGYQGMALASGALGEGSPVLGITLKIIDGDQSNRAVSLAAMAVLDQLGLFAGEHHPDLERFRAHTLRNTRDLLIGEIRPAFHLDFPASLRRKS